MEFKINVYLELDIKNMPKKMADKVKELLLDLQVKKDKKHSIMRIDVEEVK